MERRGRTKPYEGNFWHFSVVSVDEFTLTFVLSVLCIPDIKLFLFFFTVVSFFFSMQKYIWNHKLTNAGTKMEKAVFSLETL